MLGRNPAARKARPRAHGIPGTREVFFGATWRLTNPGGVYFRSVHMWSTRWRDLQGAAFFNGAGLGWWINPLNELRNMGLHTATVPLLILAIPLTHYALVRFLGIATPGSLPRPSSASTAGKVANQLTALAATGPSSSAL
ncbi:MAG: hypothetical protein WCQ50_00855 [Spirochaetota bacterium]